MSEEWQTFIAAMVVAVTAAIFAARLIRPRGGGCGSGGCGGCGCKPKAKANRDGPTRPGKARKDSDPDD